MDTPLVSIISPAYNHEKYMRQCIESVQAQTYFNWEMLILNDGSTDQTAFIAQSFARTDFRIKVFTQPNKGVFKLAETYNLGVSLAKGKYIAILECDDLWMPDKLKRQVAVLEQDPSVILCWGQAHLVHEDLSMIYRTSPVVNTRHLHLYHNIPTGSVIELSLHGIWLPALTIIIRKENLTEIGGFQQMFGMPLVDFPTILALSLHGRFHFVPEVFGKWRIYPTQTSKMHQVEIHLGAQKLVKYHLHKVTGIDAVKRKMIIRHYHRHCLVMHVRSGRYRLIRREYVRARKDFLNAIGHSAQGMYVWRFRSMVGLIMSFLHLDVEWMPRLMGRRSII